MMNNLTLYYKDACPFCVKVMDYMRENDITVKMVDITADPKNREELQKLGGKVQVPMLLIDEKPL